jgi:asparagine synthase (glutamine-hydrolysing)
MDLENPLIQLRSLLENSVKDNFADCVLLSGGLDTSILALIASKYGKPKAFTIFLKGYDSSDLRYARKVADSLKLDHFIRELSVEDVLLDLSEVIRILKSFDPMEIRNSVAIYDC